MSDKERIESYQLMIKELKNTFNKDIVTIDYKYETGISFNFINGFVVYISSSTPTGGNYVHYTPNMIIIHDPHFFNLSHFVFKNSLKVDYENGTDLLDNVFKTFANDGFYDLEKQRVNYFKLHEFKLKKLLSDYLNLGFKPENEYFLFYNDEIRPRYETGKKIIFYEEGNKIVIQDKSALLFTNDKGERYIDMSVSFHYCIENKMYLNRDILQLREISDEEYLSLSPDDKERVVVSYSPPNHSKKQYSIYEKKPDIDLNDEKYITYEKANGKIFTLKQSMDKKNKIIFYFEDEKGRVDIYHADLLIYFC